MTDENVHPYYRTILQAYAAAKRPFFHQVTPVEARELLSSSLAAAPPATELPALASVAESVMSAGDARVPVRRYRPFGVVSGSCVYLHSGGWVIGDLNTGDALCRRLAAGASCEVVSVDYRLAPEHPYPAPIEDTMAVLRCLAAEKAGPIVIAGESAGGNVAAACAISLRDRGESLLAGQFLAYPVTDHDLTTVSYQEIGSRNWLLSAADMAWFWNQYCPPSVDRNQPLVSPLRVTDCYGLPPTLIFVAELDPLRDEGLAYASRLRAGGVPTRIRMEAGMLHGYLAAAGAITAAAQAVDEAADWIKQQIHNAKEHI